MSDFIAGLKAAVAAGDTPGRRERFCQAEGCLDLAIGVRSGVEVCERHAQNVDRVRAHVRAYESARGPQPYDSIPALVRACLRLNLDGLAWRIERYAQSRACPVYGEHRVKVIRSHDQHGRPQYAERCPCGAESAK